MSPQRTEYITVGNHKMFFVILVFTSLRVRLGLARSDSKMRLNVQRSYWIKKLHERGRKQGKVGKPSRWDASVTPVKENEKLEWKHPRQPHRTRQIWQCSWGCLNSQRGPLSRRKKSSLVREPCCHWAAALGTVALVQMEKQISKSAAGASVHFLPEGDLWDPWSWPPQFVMEY